MCNAWTCHVLDVCACGCICVCVVFGLHGLLERVMHLQCLDMSCFGCLRLWMHVCVWIAWVA